MKVILIIYLILQTLAYLFLLSEFTQQDRINTHLYLAIIAIITYFLVSFRNPGFLVSRPQELNEQTEAKDEKQQQTVANKLSHLNILFCKKCQILQFKRSKHCKDCGRCVATFDHHCIWFGNCIGQKNRPFFQLCLLFNSIEISHAMIALISQMIDKRQWHRYQIVFLTFLGILIIGLVIFLGLHIILMLKNLTTWQVLRWNKISYLQEITESYGSPFSKGVIKNIAEYWSIAFSSSFKDWVFIQGNNNQVNFRKVQLSGQIVQKSYDLD